MRLIYARGPGSARDARHDLHADSVTESQRSTRRRAGTGASPSRASDRASQALVSHAYRMPPCAAEARGSKRGDAVHRRGGEWHHARTAALKEEAAQRRRGGLAATHRPGALERAAPMRDVGSTDEGGGERPVPCRLTSGGRGDRWRAACCRRGWASRPQCGRSSCPRAREHGEPTARRGPVSSCGCPPSPAS